MHKETDRTLLHPPFGCTFVWVLCLWSLVIGCKHLVIRSSVCMGTVRQSFLFCNLPSIHH